MAQMDRKPLRCMFRLHKWELKINAENAQRYEECELCGANRDKLTLSDNASGG